MKNVVKSLTQIALCYSMSAAKLLKAALIALYTLSGFVYKSIENSVKQDELIGAFFVCQRKPVKEE